MYSEQKLLDKNLGKTTRMKTYDLKLKKCHPKILPEILPQMTESKLAAGSGTEATGAQ